MSWYSVQCMAFFYVINDLHSRRECQVKKCHKRMGLAVRGICNMCTKNQQQILYVLCHPLCAELDTYGADE